MSEPNLILTEVTNVELPEGITQVIEIHPLANIGVSKKKKLQSPFNFGLNHSGGLLAWLCSKIDLSDAITCKPLLFTAGHKSTSWFFYTSWIHAHLTLTPDLTATL